MTDPNPYIVPTLVFAYELKQLVKLRRTAQLFQLIAIASPLSDPAKQQAQARRRTNHSNPTRP